MTETKLTNQNLSRQKLQTKFNRKKLNWLVTDLCKNVKCNHGARCEDGVCICPAGCPSVSSTLETSVCASDNRTYQTECHMQKAACDHALTLEILHRGPCPALPGDVLLPSGSDYDSIHRCNCNKQGSNQLLLLLWSIRELILVLDLNFSRNVWRFCIVGRI